MTFTETTNSILPCQCAEGFTTRHLNDPSCPRCNYAADVADALRREHVAALRWVLRYSNVTLSRRDAHAIHARIAELEKEPTP